MTTRIQQNTVATSCISRYTILLCTVLATSCVTGDFYIPNGEESMQYNTRERTYQKPAYGYRDSERVYGYGRTPTSYGQTRYTNIDSWQRNHHNLRYDTTTRSRPDLEIQSSSKASSHEYEENAETYCSICFDEDAFKDHGAKRCHACGQSICRACYARIRETAHTPVTYDYRDEFGTTHFELQVNCPNCREYF